MLWTIFVILLILWAVGLITGTTFSGFIHILLIIALIAVGIEVFRMATRRRTA